MSHPFLSGAMLYCLFIANPMSAFTEKAEKTGSMSATSLLLAGFART
jgi:hypothetical protein